MILDQVLAAEKRVAQNIARTEREVAKKIEDSKQQKKDEATSLMRTFKEAKEKELAEYKTKVRSSMKKKEASANIPEQLEDPEKIAKQLVKEMTNGN